MSAKKGENLHKGLKFVRRDNVSVKQEKVTLVILIDEYLKNNFPEFTVYVDHSIDQAYIDCPCVNHIGYISNLTVHIYNQGDALATDPDFLKILHKNLKFIQDYVCK